MALSIRKREISFEPKKPSLLKCPENVCRTFSGQLVAVAFSSPDMENQTLAKGSLSFELDAKSDVEIGDI
jgi:hypothetical protein